MLRTTKCGKCRTVWEYMNPDRGSIVGAPFIKCRNCLTMHKTTMNTYKNLNLFGKIWFWFGTILQDGLYFFGGLFIIIGVLFYNAPIGILIFAPIMYPPIKNITTLHKGIEALQEMVDKNGGFLWSDEQYGPP